ncbi:MAG TPA: hypothetical protein VGL28_02175 [Steroidobacteraceae bacterium]|jgi:hypothetical protein
MKHRLIVRTAAVCCLTACAGLLALAPEAKAGDRVDRSQPGGIWKYAIPPTALHGEFDNEDPVGLAAGKHIRTDCSMNWLGEDGKLYCFTTGTSLVFFEESPNYYLRIARGFFEADRQRKH